MSYREVENKRYIAECQELQGYAPKLGCPKCGGFGWVHPGGYDGKRDYSRIVVCDAPHCLGESFRNKGL